MPAIKTHNYQIAGELVITSTGNIDNLNLEGCALLRMNNASLATIRGFAAGFPGQLVTVVSIGAGQVDLAHQNAGSAAANRLVNFVTVGSTPLAAGAGSAVYQYDVTSARWRLVSHEQGAWIAVAYNSSNFSASAGVWTVDSGDQVTYAYMLVGKQLIFAFYIQATELSASAYLMLAIPGGFVAAKATRATIQVFDNNVPAVGVALVGVASTTVDVCATIGSGNFSVTAGPATYLIGQIPFEVQ